MESFTLIEQAAQYFKGIATPAPARVVEALLDAEKKARKTKFRPQFEELVGTWRLCLVTGTKRARERAGIALGAGRYLPRWVKIRISFQPAAIADLGPTIIAGRADNCVEIGALKLSLSGPTKWWRDRNLLAFDFTQISVQLFGKTLYNGKIRGGEEKEANFYTERIGKQAFFAYFYTSKTALAARGKGGGLALWVMENE